jgi:solute carrier family 25 carnitine/acylcarnitine transporter 20/29
MQSISILSFPNSLSLFALQATNQYPNVFVAVRQVYSKFGIAGLWQGVGATGMRNIPCFSAYFGMNTVAKEYFADGSNGQPLKLYQLFLAGSNPVLSFFFSLCLILTPCAGAAAGFGFWGVLYPLDVVKSRMQVQSSVMSERKYKSVLHCIRTLYKEEGAQVSQHISFLFYFIFTTKKKVFWRAYTPAIVRALFVNGAVFLAFEVSSRAIKERRAKN